MKTRAEGALVYPSRLALPIIDMAADVLALVAALEAAEANLAAARERVTFLETEIDVESAKHDQTRELFDANEREWCDRARRDDERVAKAEAALEAVEHDVGNAGVERQFAEDRSAAAESALEAATAEREANRIKGLLPEDALRYYEERNVLADELEAATETLRNLVKWSEGMGDDAFGDLFWEDARAFLARTAGGKAT